MGGRGSRRAECNRRLSRSFALPDWQSFGPADLIQDRRGSRRFVEHVEVQAGNSRVDQLLHLPGGPANADVELPFGFVLLAELVDKVVGQFSLAEGCDSLDL